MPPYNLEHNGKMYTVTMPGVIPIKVDRVYRAIAARIEKGDKRGEVTMTSVDGEKFKASWAPYATPKEKAKVRAAAKAKPRPTPAKPKLQRQKRRR